MLRVLQRPLFSRARIFLGRLKPHALPVAKKHIVLGSIGAGTGLAVTIRSMLRVLSAPAISSARVFSWPFKTSCLTCC
ncbi:hypothetical protein UA44_22680 [Klebsiella aerogenes]|nr:hypothetical protein UA44_22680 [Klebsiella aerogenes]